MPQDHPGTESQVAKKSHVDRKSLDDIVKIYVGLSRQEFYIHKELLCNVSPYFVAALKGNFKEAQDQKIEMPEEDPEAFEYFQFWTYTGRILTEFETEKDITESILIQLYVFAEIRCIPRLQNAAIDLLIDKMATSNTIHVNCLHFVYANTAEGSLLRRLFVEEIATTCALDDPNCFAQCTRDMFPIDFLFDLIQVQSQRVGKKKLRTTHFKQYRSSYHTEIPADPSKDIQEVETA